MRIGTALSFLVLLSVGMWTGTLAQGRTSDEETVRLIDDQERIAALKRDVPALERLWSDQFTVNAPNNQVVIGKRAVLETFVHRGIIRRTGGWAGSTPALHEYLEKGGGYVAPVRTPCQCDPPAVTAQQPSREVGRRTK